MRLFFYDLKRLFYRRSLVALCLLTPVAVVLIFAVVVAPLIVTGGGLHFNLALYDEDGSEPVRQFVNQLFNSQALRDIATVYPVADFDTGVALVENDDVSVFVHIPEGVFDRLDEAGEISVTVVATRAHALEAQVLSMVADSALGVVGKTRNIFTEAGALLTEKGVGTQPSARFIDGMTDHLVDNFMVRREIIGDTGVVSLMGEYVPIEYYFSAVFALFASLAMLPLVHLTATDLSGARLRRGLLSIQRPSRILASRTASGAVFIALVLLMLVPAAIALRSGGAFLGGMNTGSPPALVLTIALSALCFSALAVAAAVWLPDDKTALWTGFYAVIAMAAVSGVFVPTGALPDWASAIGRALPMRPVMRTLSATLFKFDKVIYTEDTFKILIFTAAFLVLGFAGLKRRERAR